MHGHMGLSQQVPDLRFDKPESGGHGRAHDRDRVHRGTRRVRYGSVDRRHPALGAERLHCHGGFTHLPVCRQ